MPNTGQFPLTQRNQSTKLRRANPGGCRKKVRANAEAVKAEKKNSRQHEQRMKGCEPADPHRPGLGISVGRQYAKNTSFRRPVAASITSKLQRNHERQPPLPPRCRPDPPLGRCLPCLPGGSLFPLEAFGDRSGDRIFARRR